jgi:hypothetical protein
LTLVVSYDSHVLFFLSVAEEVGKLEGNSRDTESRAKQLAARNTALNFERIKSDLHQVRKENKELAKKLRD